MRLIDADALMDDINRAINAMTAIGIVVDGDWLWAKLNDALDNAPTIEPERKTGRWIKHPEVKNVYGGTCIECSQCGEKYVVQHMEDEKYCRNCGARMEEEDE